MDPTWPTQQPLSIFLYLDWTRSNHMSWVETSVTRVG
jgi:hypothetical protein